MTLDHQLSNLQQRELKLSNLRKDILAQDSETALDMILDAPSPATLIQSFPDQDLYYLMNHIGGADFLPVLALSSSAQWEYIMDMEIWEDDRLDLRVMTQALDLLFKADAPRLLRWIIMEKPACFEFYLYHNMEIFIREHDELPPSDHEDYITIDDKFYFRFPNLPETDEDTPLEGEKDEGQEAAELIEKMVKKLAEMDLAVYHGLLLETCALLPAEAEEEEFRLKSLRLAEKGFVPPHEAVGIYQPVAVKNLRKRPRIKANTEFDPDRPMPPQCFSNLLGGENLFVKTLKEAELSLDLTSNMESELAALINKVISADRIKIRDREILEGVLSQTTAYLSLGLEILAREKMNAEDISPGTLGPVMEIYFLEDLFRTGSRAGIQLKQTSQTWYENSFLKRENLPLSFLGETFLGTLGGLFLDRPRFFDNYRSGKEIYRHFTTMEDILTTQVALDQIMALDSLLSALDPDIGQFTHGVLTYKSLVLTLWAKSCMDHPCDLTPIALDDFSSFFHGLMAAEDGSRTIDEFKRKDFTEWAAGVMDTDKLPHPLAVLLDALLDEIQDEYGPIKKADPRFMPHFFIKE